VPNSQQLAERLRAHARLYRHIAEQTWSEIKAEELIRLADECTRAAEAAEAAETKNKPDAA
jgi:3-methyladenine DNA glycosylase AlkC